MRVMRCQGVRSGVLLRSAVKYVAPGTVILDGGGTPYNMDGTAIEMRLQRSCGRAIKIGDAAGFVSLRDGF